MAGHTPGPWRVEVSSDGWDGVTTEIVGANDETVLCAWGYDAYGLEWGQHRDDAQEQCGVPDARLIAAAPELATAMTVAQIDHVFDVLTRVVPMWDQTPSALQRLRAAVVKATGDGQ